MEEKKEKKGSYRGGSYQIPCSRGGLNASLNKVFIPPESMVMGSKNLNLKGARQKRGGTAKVNSTAIADSPQLMGIFDFLEPADLQYIVFATSDGKLWKSATQTIKTGLRANEFVNIEQFGSNVFFCNNNDVPHMWNGVGNAIAMTKIPSDWNILAHKSSPVKIGALTDWSKIAGGGYHTVAIKTDGTLWTWGYNTSGQLGDGTIVDKSSPIKIGALTDWSKVAGGGYHTVAIKTDGTLWTWGHNTYGQLGDGTIAHKSSPVKIGALTDWSSVAGGNAHTIAVKTDGTLWTWGLNTNGQLGDGTIANKSSPVKIGALTDWSSVAGGLWHTVAIKTDGTLWTWGHNTYGQLGDGTIAHKSSPIQIGALTDWSSVASGDYHTVAIKTDGTLWTWGYNTDGQLGDGTIAHKSSPIQIGALTDWSSVASGDYHTVAIKTDGTLWTWGRNTYGQLGDGTVAHKSSPVKIGALTDWSSVAGGNAHTIAVKTDGTLWTWGYNTDGQLGIRANCPSQFIKHGKGNSERLWAIGCSTTPYRVYASKNGDGTDFSDANVILLNIDTGDGYGIVGAAEFQDRLFCFGRKKIYIIDDKSTDTMTWGYDSAPFEGGVAHHRLIVKTSNDLICMAEDGEIYSVVAVMEHGDYKKASLTQDTYLHDWIKDNLRLSYIDKFHAIYDPVLRAIYFFVVRKGQTTVDTALVYFIDRPPGEAWMIHDNLDFASGFNASCAGLIRVGAGDYQIYTGNYSGFIWKLGQSAKNDAGDSYWSGFKTPPLDYGDGRTDKRHDRGFLLIEPQGTETLNINWWVDGTSQASQAIIADGARQCPFSLGQRGNDIELQIYNDVVNEDFVINQIYLDFKVLGAKVAGFYAASAAGTLWTWGYNAEGQLGDGTRAEKSSPIKIGTLTDWSKVAGGGSHTAAVKTDGTLWAWGLNTDGRLGDGTIVKKSSPVKIGALTDWSSVAGGGSHTAAVKTDGTLWTWGLNIDGQLGDGTIVKKSSPVKIGALTDWSSVAGGGSHTAAVKTDGTLWAWGHNTYGQLGDGTIVKKSSPVKIGALTDWSSVAGGLWHTVAIKTDGTLWTWGRNAEGQLGDGTVVSKSSPVKIGALTDWSKVAGGLYHAVAVKTDGTLWAWGLNTSGQLGDGTIAHKSSPIKIGALTDWSSVAGGFYHTAAVKTDGTLWTWGHNTDGQLGDGTIAHKSSPIKIGALTDWSKVAGGGYHTIAVKG